jgi:hypothetical protein
MLRNVQNKLSSSEEPHSELESIDKGDFHGAFGADLMFVTGLIRKGGMYNTKSSPKKKLHNKLKRMVQVKGTRKKKYMQSLHFRK